MYITAAPYLAQHNDAQNDEEQFALVQVLKHIVLIIDAPAVDQVEDLRQAQDRQYA